MPLVIMCGTPGSGKTKRAKEIAQYIAQKHKKKVYVINEQLLGLQKKVAFSTAQQQKMTRGKIKFEVEKNLLDGVIVIADSLNYIKGVRYQMHCIARQQKTTYCVVYCNTSPQKCIEYNNLNENNYPLPLLQDLTKRMQAPQLKNRWDVPLFQRRQEEQTPVKQIADVLLFQAKKSKDPVSTKQDEKLSEDYLNELNEIMQGVNNDVLLGKIKVKNNWTAIELKKIKKDFTNIIKQKPQNLKILAEAYKNYLIEADKRK